MVEKKQDFSDDLTFKPELFNDILDPPIVARLGRLEVALTVYNNKNVPVNRNTKRGANFHCDLCEEENSIYRIPSNQEVKFTQFSRLTLSDMEDALFQRDAPKYSTHASLMKLVSVEQTVFENFLKSLKPKFSLVRANLSSSWFEYSQSTFKQAASQEFGKIGYNFRVSSTHVLNVPGTTTPPSIERYGQLLAYGTILKLRLPKLGQKVKSNLQILQAQPNVQICCRNSVSNAEDPRNRPSTKSCGKMLTPTCEEAQPDIELADGNTQPARTLRESKQGLNEDSNIPPYMLDNHGCSADPDEGAKTAESQQANMEECKSPDSSDLEICAHEDASIAKSNEDVGEDKKELAVSLDDTDVPSSAIVNLDIEQPPVSDTYIIDATAVDIDATAVDIDATAAVDIDATAVDIDATAVDIDATAVDIDNTAVDIDGTTVDIDATAVDIDATAVDIDATAVDIDATAAVDIDATAVDIDNTAADINATAADINEINATVAYINATDADINATEADIDNTGADAHGSKDKVSDSNHTQNSGMYKHVRVAISHDLDVFITDVPVNNLNGNNQDQDTFSHDHVIDFLMGLKVAECISDIDSISYIFSAFPPEFVKSFMFKIQVIIQEDKSKYFKISPLPHPTITAESIKHEVITGLLLKSCTLKEMGTESDANIAFMQYLDDCGAQLIDKSYSSDDVKTQLQDFIEPLKFTSFLPWANLNSNSLDNTVYSLFSVLDTNVIIHSKQPYLINFNDSPEKGVVYVKPQYCYEYGLEVVTATEYSSLYLEALLLECIGAVIIHVDMKTFNIVHIEKLHVEDLAELFPRSEAIGRLTSFFELLNTLKEGCYLYNHDINQQHSVVYEELQSEHIQADLVLSSQANVSMSRYVSPVQLSRTQLTSWQRHNLRLPLCYPPRRQGTYLCHEYLSRETCSKSKTCAFAHLSKAQLESELGSTRYQEFMEDFLKPKEDKIDGQIEKVGARNRNVPPDKKQRSSKRRRKSKQH